MIQPPVDEARNRRRPFSRPLLGYKKAVISDVTIEPLFKHLLPLLLGAGLESAKFLQKLKITLISEEKLNQDVDHFYLNFNCNNFQRFRFMTNYVSYLAISTKLFKKFTSALNC